LHRSAHLPQKTDVPLPSDDWLDLFQVAQYEDRLKVLGFPFIRSQQRHAYISYPRENDQEIDSLPEVHLKLPIVYLKHPSLPASTMRILSDYYSYETFLVPDDHYAIQWESMPSADELIRCFSVLRVRTFVGAGPFQGLQKAVKQFADYYCSIGICLPLVSNPLCSFWYIADIAIFLSKNF
jgi:hypothetical protein